MKKLVLANICFGIVFVLFQVFLMFGHIDPMEIKDYIEQGGNTFDYYLGYNLFCCPDLSGVSYFWEHILRTITATIPILLITSIWLNGVGIDIVLVILNCFVDETSTDNKETTHLEINKRALIITTLLSIYYLYYSIVYVTNFWLQ